jgi:membrane-associated phospholipid phosphatase
MNNRHLFLAVIFSCLACFQKVNGQDSIHAIAKPDSALIIVNNPYRFTYKKLIIPSLFIAYGVAGLKIDELRELDRSTRHEIWEHQPDHIRLDNYTQYAPALMVYGLNVAGVRGRHNIMDRTIIYATSQLISSAFVVPLKHIIKEERPDGSDKLSFPSGHTATAFSSAQFMFREYKDNNFGLSISGYSFALFTGVYRTLNDKHWVSDVVAGAGFGILSTELAYCLYPRMNTLFTGKNKKATTMIMPVYQNKSFGIGLVKNF